MTTPALRFPARSLDALLARASAPEAPDRAADASLDHVLLMTVASALKQLQDTVQEQQRQIDKWKRRVTDLEAREDV